MAQHVGREVAHVVRQHVVAAAQVRKRTRAFDQMDGRARACAERHVFREIDDAVAVGLARRRGEPHRILNERRIDVAVAALSLQRRELVGRGDGGDVDRNAGDALDDDELLLLVRIADQHLHHEAIDLRLGQRIGAFGLDRVLRGHHQERRRHDVRLAGDRHLVFLHHLEQRALHLGRGAIDLVGEQQVGEHRPERRREVAGLLVVDPRANQVRRHEVGRELDATERAADDLGEGLHRQRLREAGHAFDEQVALRENRHQHAFEEVILADDDLLHFVEDALHQRRNVVATVFPVVHTFPGGLPG